MWGSTNERIAGLDKQPAKDTKKLFILLIQSPVLIIGEGDFAALGVEEREDLEFTEKSPFQQLSNTSFFSKFNISYSSIWDSLIPLGITQ